MLNLKVAFKKAIAKIAFKKAVAKIEIVSILLNEIKAFFDVFVTSDNQTLSIHKKPDDAVAFAEAQSKDFAKTINETFYVTDDLDGEASADDEQNITFVKVRSEILSITDSVSILFNQGRAFSDSSAISDSGSLRSQGYVNTNDYFSEDYVGESRTF